MNKIQLMLFFIIMTFGTQINVLEVSSSVRPIITTSMPEEVTIGLQDYTLRWYVIDDNIKNYSIYINESIWKSEIAQSNIIECTFSNPVGTYNITLEVQDFSNFTTQYQMIINVTQTSQSTNTENTSTMTTTQTGAAFGFAYVETMVALTIVSSSIVLYRLKERKKRF